MESRGDFQEKPLENTQGSCYLGVLLNCFLEVKCEVTALKVPKEAIVIGRWFPGVLSAWDTFGVMFVGHPSTFLTRTVALLFSFCYMIAPALPFL